jgi:hypothetical protein
LPSLNLLKDNAGTGPKPTIFAEIVPIRPSRDEPFLFAAISATLRSLWCHDFSSAALPRPAEPDNFRPLIATISNSLERATMGSVRDIPKHTSMDSSGVLLFRVAVMLCCLILVPAAAIFGSQFPQLVRQYVEQPLRKLLGWESAAAAEPWKLDHTDPMDVAPPFSPGPNETSAHAPSYAAPAPQWQSPPTRQAVPHETEYVHGQFATQPIARDVTGVQPATTNQRAAAKGDASVPQVGDRFSYIQHLLRLYGALNYRLEAAGPSGQLYQFSCQMPPLDGNPAQFSVTNADPLQAMDQVLKQVESWRDRVLQTASQAR